MKNAKIAISIESSALLEMDRLVGRGVFPSRSQLIQIAVSEKLERLGRQRLARECAKLRPEEERAAAEEHFTGEVEWPAY
ncbi:MAG TPA: CopG family transcriptional regulator [Thermoanaerobaculia bacterium]|jgi:Arc/MetJ-type ribon-helix-helix transcriptional regulator|nr:CopG family transcriptional regulator [Thermoanaerobaculia bacterium]